VLQNTFLHLPGISEKKERELWSRGIWHWEEFYKAYPELGAPRQTELFSEYEAIGGHREALIRTLNDSMVALEQGDADFFAKRLPPKEHYRIALTFPNQTAFLDIETTGLSHHYDITTLVGVSIGDEYRAHVRGDNTKAIAQFLSTAKCLVTFNGKIFDLRFMRNDFPGLPLPEGHIDLRFFSKSNGLSGGQKAIEATLGVKRDGNIEDIIGEKAPTLWHEYRLGDLEAAKQLIQYNHADVEGMKHILDATLERLWSRDSSLSSFHPLRFSEMPSKFAWASKRATVAKNRIYVQRFRGKKGPKITYDDLATNRKSRKLRVVGIDLTGSEAKESGWALLSGNITTTKLIGSDDEIIAATCEAKPDVVSIDSPLSMPKGRTKVTDDDPRRDEIGIMRQCERELKRRGVNVYPSLIPSMQKLTARGMRIAKRFRKLGIPTIESYPGAAQDIMAIPRKRAGLQYLCKGLSDFGVHGNFEGGLANHDELDAITSAIVGLFFWAGRFEALGNEDEEYLIIPDLEATGRDWRGRKVIGVSGPMAAGKTTAGEFLTKHGFIYGRYSQVLEGRLRARNKPINRSTLQDYGDYVHKKYGQRWLGNRLVEHCDDQQRIVIDGLRFPEDHAFLVEKFGPGFTHFYVEASESKRKTRYISRGGTEKEFESAKIQSVESEVKSLKRIAHREAPNDTTKKAFYESLAKGIRFKRT